MPNNELQEILGARFEEHTHTTDESVWDAIESQLDAEKSDRAGFWFWIFNGVAATLFIGLMVQSTIYIDSEIKSPKSHHVKTGINQQEVKTEPLSNQFKVSENKNNLLIESSEPELEPKESLSSRSFLRESEAIGITENEGEIAIFNDLENEQSRNKSTQTPLDLSLHSTLSKTQHVDIANLAIQPLITFSNKTEISNTYRKLPRDHKHNSLRKLPIHLGFEISYLHRSHFETSSLKLSDLTDSSTSSSTISSTNYPLEESRHFEFSLFSQFDLTKRFSTSVGIGYSQSNFVNENWGETTLNDPYIYTIESHQRFLTIPLQAKFAFIQKNRVIISSGLTLQGEFGEVVSSKTDQTSGSVSITAPSIYSIQPYVYSKSRIQQFALEPFVQLSIGISPRFSAFGNLGYRWYFGKKINENPSPTGLNYVNADIGIMFQIR